MSAVLGVCMVLVGLWCGARFVLPALRVEGHARDLEVWHLLMVAAMLAMLLASPEPALRTAGLVVFLAGTAWAVVQLVRRRVRAAYLRLLVACAAMAAMLLPAAPAVAASGSAGGAGGGTGGTGGMDGMVMHGSGGSTGVVGGHHMVAALPGPLVALLVLGLVGVLAVSVVRLVVSTSVKPAMPVRADAICEGAMAVAMGCMLLAVL
jgi:hypothetical protein